MSVLRISGLAKRFGPTVALDGVDLVLHPGEVHALIGENGAGKSTLMGIVAGALHADRGEMQLDDRPYAPPSPLEARRRGIALIHQELSLCPHLSVAENILLGIEPSRWSTSPIRISRPTPGWARCRSRPSRWSRSAAPWPPTRVSS